MSLPLDHPEARLVKLSGTPADFHPHGISILRARDGTLTLMAVNHRATAPAAVEIFDVMQAFLPDGTRSSPASCEDGVRQPAVQPQ